MKKLDETEYLLRSAKNAERLRRSIQAAEDKDPVIHSQALVHDQARPIDHDNKIDWVQSPFDRDQHE